MTKNILKESSIGKTISTEKGHYLLSFTMKVAARDYIAEIYPQLFEAPKPEEKKVEEKSK